MYEVPHVAARASVQPRALKLRLLALMLPALATPCACRGQLEQIGYHAEAGRPGPALAPPRTALLVGGDPATLTGADTKIKVRIEARGFTVTAADAFILDDVSTCP